MRFGRIVRSRREQLGIQQEDLDQYGGPSSTTLSRIERGVADPSAKTLRKLDQGLRWASGSAKRALDGGEPTPLDSVAHGGSVGWAGHATSRAGHAETLSDVINAAIEAVQKLSEAAFAVRNMRVLAAASEASVALTKLVATVVDRDDVAPPQDNSPDVGFDIVRDHDAPPALPDAARTAPPGYQKGNSEQGEANGDENQDQGE